MYVCKLRCHSFENIISYFLLCSLVSGLMEGGLLNKRVKAGFLNLGTANILIILCGGRLP